MSEPGWTIDTLKEHFEALLDRDLAARDRALAAMEKRLDGMNEFRSALADQQRTLMPRAEAELIRDGHAGRLGALENFNEERRGARGGWTWAIGVFGAIGTLFGLWAMFHNK